MKLKKRSKSNLNQQELVQLKKETFRIKEASKHFAQLHQQKKSLAKGHNKENLPARAMNASKSHDKIFLKLLSKKTKNLNPEKTIKTMKSIKDTQIVVSKQILSQVLETFTEKFKKQEGETLNLFHRKQTLQTKSPFKKSIDVNLLKNCQQTALRQLVKEEFNLQSSKDLNNIKGSVEAEQFLVLLFQKELLLENLLTVLEQNKIDVNSLLYSAFENIQCENYIPKTGQSLLQEGYFELEDKVAHPPQKEELSSSLKEKLFLDLKAIHNSS